MATQTIENFNTLDLETLASVEGGGCSWRGAAGATVQGAIGLSLIHIYRIVVIDQGRVVETGSHQDLMSYPGFYYQLFRK